MTKTSELLLDLDGFAHISRDDGKSLVKLLCPFSSTTKGGLRPCGIWCPHFSNPEPYRPKNQHGESKKESKIIRLTCGKDACIVTEKIGVLKK